MKAKLSGYLPILLQMIAPRMGVRMQFGDIQTGSASREVVTITNSVLQMQDRKKAEKLALGLLCHEGLNHILQMDWKVWDKFTQQYPEGVCLLNIIEDCRGEKRSWIMYPGVKDMLNDVCLVLSDKLKLPEGNVEPADALVNGLLHVLRGEFLEQSMDPKGGWKLLNDTFGPKAAKEIVSIAMRGCEGDSTKDAADAALDILKLLNMLRRQVPQQLDQQPDQQSSQDSQQQDVGSSSDQSNQPSQQEQDQDSDQGQGQDSGQSQDQDSGQGQGQDSSQSQDQDSGQGQDQEQGQNNKPQKGKDKGQRSAAKQQGPLGQSQQAKNAATALQQMKNGKVQETDLGSLIQNAVDSSPQDQGSGSTPIYGKIRVLEPSGGKIRNPGTDVLAASRRMAAKLEQLMMSRVDDDDRLSYAGDLEGNLVARVKLLDTQVFREEGDEAEGIDSAFLFLLDASGSMSDIVDGVTRADLCFNAAWAASSAIAKYKPYGVELAIWSYGSYLTKLVDFGGWSFQQERFKQYNNNGGTATFPACVEATGALAAKKQKRKHLVLFSDGDLGGEPTEKHLIEAHKAGIEVSVIFIGQEYTNPSDVSKVLKDRVYIVHNTNSIVNAMFNCLKPR